MIFVTVGSTMPFDELIQEVDRLAGEGFFGTEVCCQIGHSAYVPQHCDHFWFKPCLEAWFEAAECLFVHGGTGSTIEALLSGKPFAAFANPRAADDHQAQFLSRMSADYPVVWSRDWRDIAMIYPELRSRPVQAGSPYPRMLADNIIRVATEDDRPKAAPLAGMWRRLSRS